jgi:uncharacterized protein YjbI with pentapeptide repeats
MTAEELLERYAAGERDFVGVGLSGVLEDADLSGINLMGACLTQVRIVRSNLTKANLSSAYMLHSRMTDVNLTNADLRAACMVYADWRNVNLSNACMWYANLTGASLKDANLSYTDFEKSILIETNMLGAINTEFVFRINGAFIWKLKLPDGSINEGPCFARCEY